MSVKIDNWVIFRWANCSWMRRNCRLKWNFKEKKSNFDCFFLKKQNKEKVYQIDEKRWNLIRIWFWLIYQSIENFNRLSKIKKMMKLECEKNLKSQRFAFKHFWNSMCVSVGGVISIGLWNIRGNKWKMTKKWLKWD